ncbi:unnamed protein product, partial [marine sediment metagenome]
SLKTTSHPSDSGRRDRRGSHLPTVSFFHRNWFIVVYVVVQTEAKTLSQTPVCIVSDVGMIQQWTL